MKVKSIALKDRFPFLGENGCEPVLDVYTPKSLYPERNRAGLLILPGGGYGECSEREGEPVAVEFLDTDMEVFVLRYSGFPPSCGRWRQRWRSSGGNTWQRKRH